jgi:ligand-binding sensor domain-containing protein
MKTSVWKLIFLFNFLLLKGISFAQNSNFVTYGMEEGLIMSQIETVVQDQKGYLWIGTIGGLSKYDGVKFTNYTQKNGLAEDWITRSALASNGDIYFGHWGGGISCWSAMGDSLIDLKLERHTEFKYITDLIEIENTLYISTDGAGVLKYNIEKKAIEKVDLGSPSLQINALSLDQFKNIWICSDLGIDVFSSTQNKVLKHLDEPNIQQALQAYDHEMWLASNEGIIKLIYSSAYEIQDRDYLNKEDGLTSNNIKTIYADIDKNIWIGTKDQGIIQFIPSKQQSKNKTSQGEINIFSSKFELKYYHANCFWQDREGNIWVGTEIGLNKYMGDLFRVYNHNDNLINNLVWSILEDSKGRLWFGTTEGISIFTFPNLKGKLQYNNPSTQVIGKEAGLNDLIVTALFEDKQGRIWAGTENGGLHVIENDKISQKIGKQEGLLDQKIFTINQDKQGFIWAGTRKGLAKIDPVSFQVQSFTAADGLGGDKVYHIFKDSKEDLWFGLLGGFLTKYEQNTFKIFDEKSGLNAKFILSITEDKEHTLWMSTYGSGIVSYKNGKFTTLNVDSGLSSNNTHFITTDNKGIDLDWSKFGNRKVRRQRTRL